MGLLMKSVVIVILAIGIGVYCNHCDDTKFPDSYRDDHYWGSAKVKGQF